MSSAPQDFGKYAVEGAYHWAQLRPSLKTTFNPYLLARYQLAGKYFPAPSRPGAMAADLGCGDGYMAGQLRAKGYSVEGIDGSDTAIGLARGLLGEERMRLRVGNVLDTGLADSSIDLVTNLDVIEHLEDPGRLLKEIRRIGRDGATALIGTPVRFTEQVLDKYHVQEFFPAEFSRLLASELAVEAVHFSHPVQWYSMMSWRHTFLGRQWQTGHNLINLWYLLSGRNLLAEEGSKFPTYQLAVCRIRK